MYGEGDTVLKHKNSILFGFILSNIIALFIVAVFYILGLVIAKDFVNKYIESSDIIIEYEEKNCFAFQKYIRENEVSIENIALIEQWAEKHPNQFFKLYRDDELIFDSVWDSGQGIISSVSSEKLIHSGDTYEIEFSDDVVYAKFKCDYKAKLINTINIIMTVLSVMIYIAIVSFYLLHKVNYIKQIKLNISNLSIDNLKHPIEVKGNDELAQLANEVNSFQQNIANYFNEKMTLNNEHCNLITAMSHDLRAPLTSLIGYLEIASSESDGNINEVYNYQKMAINKAYYIKELVDKLFAFFLIIFPNNNEKVERVQGNELIFQIIEEAAFDLESSGIRIERDFSDITCFLDVNITLVRRLVDNIFSNIEKYADLSKPIKLQYYLKDNYLFFSIENTISNDISIENSSKIGLKSCEIIMAKHHGNLNVEKQDNRFRIIASFPEVICEH